MNNQTNISRIVDIQKNRDCKHLSDYVVGEVQLFAGHQSREVSKKIYRAVEQDSTRSYSQRTILIVSEETNEVGKVMLVKRLK